MGIVLRDRVKDPQKYAQDLVVDLSGLDIIVRAGSFKLAGRDYALGEDTTHTVSVDGTYDTSVMGWLVLDGVNVEILVDEVMHNGIDEMYKFAKSQPYMLLGKIFNVQRVPPGTTDLTTMTVNAYRHVSGG